MMKPTLVDFIYSGSVGELTLGMSRAEVMAKLREPESWLGKPPGIGPIVSSADAATVWFYYGNAVGIRFDQRLVVVRINVLPEKMTGQAPFGNWPIGSGATVADLRKYLIEQSVPFYEELEPDDAQFILAGKLCVAQCECFKNGQVLPRDERPLIMISTVAEDQFLPDYVRGKKQREWSLLNDATNAGEIPPHR